MQIDRSCSIGDDSIQVYQSAFYFTIHLDLIRHTTGASLLYSRVREREVASPAAQQLTLSAESRKPPHISICARSTLLNNFINVCVGQKRAPHARI